MQTSSAKEDLFSTFATRHVAKAFVQVDELTAIHEHADALKNLITSDEIRCEKKGNDTITVGNYANLLFTSNNRNTLPITPDDRRFVLFQCSDAFRNNHAYFANLASQIDSPQVGRAMYQFLKARDIQRYGDTMQPLRPKTIFYRSMQRLNLSPLKLFLSAMINDHRLTGELQAARLYDMYEQFHQQISHDDRCKLTKEAFGREVTTVVSEGEKHRTTKGIVYRFDVDALRQTMESQHTYDPDSHFF